MYRHQVCDTNFLRSQVMAQWRPFWNGLKTGSLSDFFMASTFGIGGGLLSKKNLISDFHGWKGHSNPLGRIFGHFLCQSMYVKRQEARNYNKQNSRLGGTSYSWPAVSAGWAVNHLEGRHISQWLNNTLLQVTVKSHSSRAYVSRFYAWLSLQSRDIDALLY